MADIERYAQAYRESAQERVTDEEVLGAWLFYRTGGKNRAAGFPNTFLLAVTPTRVRAFKAKPRRNGVKLGDELAVWNRDGLVVTVREAALNTEVTIESPAEGEKVVCSTGKDAHSRAFLELLEGDALPAPALA